MYTFSQAFVALIYESAKRMFEWQRIRAELNIDFYRCARKSEILGINLLNF
jgi:hypothetical protein